MLELGLGGQKFVFRKKALGAPQPKVLSKGNGGGERASQASQEKKKESPAAQAQAAPKRVIERMTHPLGKRGGG